MRNLIPTLLLGAFLVSPGLTGLQRVEAGPAADLPTARRVIVRGQKRLDRALLGALGDHVAVPGGTALLILDVTSNTRRQADTISAALRMLEPGPSIPSHWRIAALGGSASKAVVGPAALAPLVAPLLATDTGVPNTIEALKKTIRSLKGRSGAVLYLADWRFEDAHDVEGLLRVLKQRNLGFGVVGSEAAFGRAWNDGILDVRDQMQNGQLVLKDGSKQKLYDDTIGRRPFGPFQKDAPWYGGDTAYPHLPYRYSGRFWQTEFDPSALRFGKSGSEGLKPGVKLEDLLERMGRKQEVFDSATSRKTALPSAFGPHGLMRAAAQRGGRYVLWSWNPSKRASLTYDFARCDQFGPDLRSRSAIRKDAARRPLARALLAAWDAVGSKYNALAAHTAPLDRSGTRPQSIDLLERSAASLPLMWMNRDMHKEFLRKATFWRDAARSGAKRLARALRKVGTPTDSIDQRQAADAALFRHILLVLEFELSEALAAAAGVPKDAWDSDTYPGLRMTPWIERGDDPDQIQKTGATLFDKAHGARLEEARRTHLRRFRGTPFGVQVAANTVETWRLTKGQKMKPSTGRPTLPGRTPSESQGVPAVPSPRPPSGGSSGGGPSTGR